MTTQEQNRFRIVVAPLLAIGLLVVLTGCQGIMSTQMNLDGEELVAPALQTGASGEVIELADGHPVPNHSPIQPGKEGAMVSLPEYRVEPPDILLINAIRMAPKSPYFIQTMDVLQIWVFGTPEDRPQIAGQYQVDPAGMVNLGPSYGMVQVEGKTLTEITDHVNRRLQQVLPPGVLPEVSVTLIQSAGQQQIAGEHLVGPDGTINLGMYGTVYVAGLTVNEVRDAVERHLSQYLDEPSVSVDVFAYNSKTYYIITEGAGLGDNVVELPVTGNDTVLRAISRIGGLTRLSSKSNIYIARPAPPGVGCDQILPVDWVAITKGGNAATNYQLLPGDRVFVGEDRMIAFDGTVSKLTQPFERLLGFTLLGSQTIQNINRFPKGFRNL